MNLARLGALLEVERVDPNALRDAAEASASGDNAAPPIGRASIAVRRTLAAFSSRWRPLPQALPADGGSPFRPCWSRAAIIVLAGDPAAEDFRALAAVVHGHLGPRRALLAVTGRPPRTPGSSNGRPGSRPWGPRTRGGGPPPYVCEDFRLPGPGHRSRNRSGASSPGRIGGRMSWPRPRSRAGAPGPPRFTPPSRSPTGAPGEASRPTHRPRLPGLGGTARFWRFEEGSRRSEGPGEVRCGGARRPRPFCSAMAQWSIRMERWREAFPPSSAMSRSRAPWLATPRPLWAIRPSKDRSEDRRSPSWAT